MAAVDPPDAARHRRLWLRPRVALDIAREAAAVAAEFARTAQTDWGAEEQQDAPPRP